MHLGSDSIRDQVLQRCLDVNSELQCMIESDLAYTEEDLIRENQCMISILLYRSFFPQTIFSTEEVIELLIPIIESLAVLNSFEITGEEDAISIQLQSTFYTVVLLSKLFLGKRTPDSVMRIHVILSEVDFE